MKELTTIGRVERVALPQLSVGGVPAKIDTGADLNSIWATARVDEDSKLHVIFFGPESPFYDGTSRVFPKGEYAITRVSNSFGHKEVRYKLKLKIKIKGRTINGSFSLSDRSEKLYPILIGRSLLHKKFAVDVSRGKPLRGLEASRKEKLKRDMEDMGSI